MSDVLGDDYLALCETYTLRQHLPHATRSDRDAIHSRKQTSRTPLLVVHFRLLVCLNQGTSCVRSLAVHWERSVTPGSGSGTTPDPMTVTRRLRGNHFLRLSAVSPVISTFQRRGASRVRAAGYQRLAFGQLSFRPVGPQLCTTGFLNFFGLHTLHSASGSVRSLLQKDVFLRCGCLTE